MGKNIRIHRYHLCCHRSGRLMVSLFLLFLSSLIQVRYSAEGRAIPRNVHTNAKHIIHGTEEQRVTGEEERAVEMIMQSVIGSRPPRCDRRSCKSCAHCQAVQVPVAPQVQGNPPGKVAYMRGDDISNYKPMTWKCKCGDSFFNP